MTETDIANALKQALHALTGLPVIVRENEDAAALQPPRIEVQVFRNDPAPRTLGYTHDLTGFMQVTVVAQGGDFTAAAEATAEAIAAAFPAGTSVTAGDGRFKISRRPAIKGGFIDGQTWRLPVHVPYRGFAASP